MTEPIESPQVAPQGPALVGDAPGVDFLRIYHTLLKRLWLVGLVFVIVVAGVTAWTWRQIPVYRAEATLIIDPSAPQVLKNVPEVVETGAGNFWSTREYFETQYKILRSRMVAERVVARLGLDHDEGFLGVDTRLDAQKRAEILKRADPARAVIGAISIQPVKDSRVVNVGVEDTNPQRAADLANAVAEEYIEQNVDRKLSASQSASAWLAEQLTTIRKRLEDSERALYAFKQKHDVLTTSLEARQNISTEKLVQISDALTKSALRRTEIEARLQALKELLAQSAQGGAEFKAEAFRSVADNALINDLKREYFRLQAEKAELVDRYLDAHPRRVALGERIAKVRSDIQHGIENVIVGVQSDFRQICDEEKRLKILLESAKREALGVNKLEVQYQQLKRERDQNQQVYELMVKRQKEVDVSSLLKTNNIRLLDAALVPTAPVRPRRGQNILVAILIGLVLGVGLVFILDMLDNTVKSQDDIEHQLGLPLLGILPSIPVQATSSRENPRAQIERDLFVSQSPSSAVSECARAIRTSLLFASPDHPFKVLLVTSTGPREGKTTTAVSIGITMAQGGQRVLLVDGDLRRPRLHRTFGVPSGAGLSTLILGESTIEDSVKSTGVDRLFLLPAGPVPPNPAELLQSQHYAAVLERLGQRFDRIVIDSAPVGVVTDGLVMANRADGLVLVLRSGITPKKAAWRGRRALQDVKAHIYGAVLNDVDLGSRAGQYYYYYRYGYYPTEQQEAASKS